MDEATLPQGEQLTRPEVSDAQILESVREHGKDFFSGFGVIDTTEFDGYKPEEDVNDRGRVLYLTTEAGRGEGKPEIRIIFRKDGFTFGFLNSPEPDKPYTARNVGDSFYGPVGRKWQTDEMDLAMLYGKIRMEGVDAESAEFLDQVVGWDEAAGKMLTMREAMTAYSAFKKEKKVNRKVQFINLQPQDQTRQEKLRELVLARVASGDSSFSQQLIERFNSDPEFAKSLIRTETTRMNANLSLMADRGKLPPVALCEVDYKLEGNLPDPINVDMMLKDQ